MTEGALTAAERQRFEDAGIPAERMGDVARAVNLFDDGEIRESMVTSLIAAWEHDRQHGASRG